MIVVTDMALSDRIDEQAREFYRDAMRTLQRAQVRFLIGGAFALESYASISRWTKDLDLFIRPSDREAVLSALRERGYPTELRFPHWLAKVFGRHTGGGPAIDVIFSSGNGLCTVDDDWFDHAVPAIVLGIPVWLTPPEEMIWSKAFVMERDRYDGADIAHLIRAHAKSLDWPRLLRRFGGHWRVLLCHLVLFGYIYPAQRLQVPRWIMDELLRRFEIEMSYPPRDHGLCQGTLLSWSQYLQHIEHGEYSDARHRPHGMLTEVETALVTERLSREQERNDHGR